LVKSGKLLYLQLYEFEWFFLFYICNIQEIISCHASFDFAPVTKSGCGLTATRSSVVNSCINFVRGIGRSRTVRAISVQVILDTSGGTGVIIRAYLPSRSWLLTVSVIRRLDLVISTAQGSNIHVATKSLAARLDLAKTMKKFGGWTGHSQDDHQ
jgi:hypothetical protein